MGTLLMSNQCHYQPDLLNMEHATTSVEMCWDVLSQGYKLINEMTLRDRFRCVSNKCTGITYKIYTESLTI